MGVKYISEISLIGLVNWVLGLEKGTIWIVPFFSFIDFLILNNKVTERSRSQLFTAKSAENAK